MAFAPHDHDHMQRALELAARGRGYVEPNPMVGAVIVREGRVLGDGWHRRFGAPHAEIEALQAARSGGHDVAGATLYCTLEPCAHHGKTPPCAPALVEAGVARVVIATEDPLSRRHAGAKAAGVEHAQGKGTHIFARSGVKVEVGLLADEAVVLNAAFFKLSRTAMPLVTAKWAMSADGRIASRTGSSRWLSCEQSRRLVHEVRGLVDAVIVGGGTARRDDPLLTCRDAEKRRTASRVVLCGQRLPSPGSKLARTAREVPVLLAHVAGTAPCGLEELVALGCEPLPLPSAEGEPGYVCPAALLKALGERGATNVLLEGGAEAFGTFFDRGLVDRVMVFICPLIVGGAQALGAVGGSGAETVEDAIRIVRPACAQQVGTDLLIEGWTSDPLQWKP